MVGKDGRVAALTILYALGLGCSESASNADDLTTGDQGGDPVSFDELEAFEEYCTGTLLIEKELEPGPSGRRGTGAIAPAGTEFLVSEAMPSWTGYVIYDNGGSAEISAEFGEGLVEGVDFESPCLPGDDLNPYERMMRKHFVVLEDARFHASRSLSGPECRVPAGTAFSNYRRTAIGERFTLSSDDLESICGFRKGYTDRMADGRLMAKE